jgi:peptidoglycan/xylan/chitin deacetylase (PgdA/CDA1 family)
LASSVRRLPKTWAAALVAAVLVLLPAPSRGDLTGSATSPLGLMEDFLILREKALDRAVLDEAHLLTMEDQLEKLSRPGSETTTPELQVLLFIQKGYAFLARKGGQLAARAKDKARKLLATSRPAPRHCTYLDSGGIKVIFRGDPKRKEIALTYDDGPIEGALDSDRGTRALLKVLADTGSKATFFMVGQNAKAYPHLVQLIRRGGHSVANHTRTHAQGKGLPRLSIEGMRDEVGIGKKLISDAMGSGPMPLFRLPYGAGVHTDRVNRVVGEYHQFNVFWTIDSNDWRRPGAQSLIDSVLDSSMQNGAIVLFHDHAPHVATATKKIITTLQPKGYRFVTVDEMLGIDRQTAFLEAFEQAAGHAEQGRDQSAYESFVRLAANAPSVVLAQEALDFAYLCARMSLGPRAVQAARMLLARTISPTGELPPEPPPPAPTESARPIVPEPLASAIHGAPPIPASARPLLIEPTASPSAAPATAPAPASSPR